MKTTVYRVGAVAAISIVAFGAALVLSGTAWARTPHVHLRIDNALHQIQLTIPTPPCPPSQPGCQWMLYVNEPRVPGGPTVAAVTGSSGQLTVPFPAFCGEIQADALVGPAPWVRQGGMRQTINTCPTTGGGGGTTPPGTTPPGATTLPFTGTGEPGATPAAAVQAADATGAPAAQLPFTGLNIGPLVTIGWAMVLAGGLLLIPVGLRHRVRMRAAAIGVAGWRDGARRTGMWFFGL